MADPIAPVTLPPTRNLSARSYRRSMGARITRRIVGDYPALAEREVSELAETVLVRIERIHRFNATEEVCSLLAALQSPETVEKAALALGCKSTPCAVAAVLLTLAEIQGTDPEAELWKALWP